ncbi:hypothetical protein NXS19_003650 [Fusarium pseudograminearum]|nr:hypothetical protein NXS19_003650 [Fusarium pseudograminearum]
MALPQDPGSVTEPLSHIPTSFLLGPANEHSSAVTDSISWQPDDRHNYPRKAIPGSCGFDLIDAMTGPIKGSCTGQKLYRLRSSRMKYRSPRTIMHMGPTWPTISGIECAVRQDQEDPEDP